MDDEELTRLAEQEILRETKLAAERAAVYGALGWMKCPLKPTNKQFLVNTILPTLSTNRKHHYADRRDYHRTDEGTYSRGFSPVDRSSHYSKRESVSEGKGVYSHRDNKDSHRSNRERHDKDYSPSHKSRLPESNSIENNSKEYSSYGTENKNADEHKESDYARHKSSRERYFTTASHKPHDDNYSHRKSDDSYHHKIHDDYSSTDQRHRDNEQRHYKTEILERRTKSRIDGRPATNEDERILGIEFENFKTQNDNRRTSDTRSKLKHSESTMKHDKVKDEVSYSTGNDKDGHFTAERPQLSKNNSFSGKDMSAMIENISNSDKDTDKKSICHNSDYPHHSNGEHTLKKRKTSQKRKKDKSKKLKGTHCSDTRKAKKKKHKTTLTAKNSSSEAVVDKVGIAKTDKTDNESENSNQDVEKKHSIEGTLKMQQCAYTKNDRCSREKIKYFEGYELLDNPKHRVQENEAKQVETKLPRTQKIDVDSNVNRKAEKRKLKKTEKSYVTKDDKNCSKNSKTNIHSGGQAKKPVGNKLNTSDMSDSSYSSPNFKMKEDIKEWNKLSRHDTNSNYSKKDSARNCYTSENHDVKELCRTNSRSSKDVKNLNLKNHHVHHGEKSNCLRDITDEMCYRGIDNSKQSKRRKWSIESD